MFDLIPSWYHKKCRVMLEAGVDTDEYKPSLTSASTKDQVLRLLYVGRIAPYKGLLYVLRCLDALPLASKAKVHLTVIGDRGEGEKRHCKEFVAQRGLGEMVTFAGFRPNRRS